MLGVVTVKRMTLWVPALMPPSCTLQNSAGKSSTRVTQLFWVALLSTMRSGNADVSTALRVYCGSLEVIPVGRFDSTQATIETSERRARKRCIYCLRRADKNGDGPFGMPSPGNGT